MKQEIDIHNEPEMALNSLLDEINKQRRLTIELQSELRSMRTREIRQNKNSEILKSENLRLKQDVTILEQKLRELEIQLALPESDRIFTSSQAIDPFPQKPIYKKIKWAYFIVPLLIIAAIVAFKWQSSQANNRITADIAAATTEAITHSNTEGIHPVTTPPSNEAVEDGYLLIQNPLDGEGMVRVMDGYGQKARFLAWTSPGDKYRIRAQSPTKMYKTFLQNGKKVTIEDYFYKISDKEQWVFGYFSTKRAL